jgi:GNAT superfamily N-acetyltransferase
MIEIIAFEKKYAPIFKQINLEWLDKCQLTESHDLMVLDDPEGTIIKTGGCIFLATDGKEIAGSAALMKEGEGVFELAKMTVRPEYQGKGISKLLLQRCLDEAIQLKAKKIMLFSNHQLKKAIQLYEQFGFKHVAVTDSPFTTADIKMELLTA